MVRTIFGAQRTDRKSTAKNLVPRDVCCRIFFEAPPHVVVNELIVCSATVSTRPNNLSISAQPFEEKV